MKKLIVIFKGDEEFLNLLMEEIETIFNEANIKIWAITTKEIEQ